MLADLIVRAKQPLITVSAPLAVSSEKTAKPQNQID